MKEKIEKFEVSSNDKKAAIENLIPEIDLAVYYIEELLIAFNSDNEELWQSDNLMIKKDYLMFEGLKNCKQSIHTLLTWENRQKVLNYEKELLAAQLREPSSAFTKREL
ncbi:MAG: hypothetical protein ACRCZN_13910 [Lactococcus lactis]